MKKTSFGFLPDGKEVFLYHLECGKFSVAITDFGATLIKFSGPDRDGNPTDVVLGFDEITPYIGDVGYMGSVIGRFANRIEKGKFTLNGKEYNLYINNGPNHLHGGKVGFSHKVFEVKELSDTQLEFSLFSPDNDEGYPGNINVSVVYSLSADGTLTLDYSAKCDADTIINLTNHAYFNLDGADKGTVIYDHNLELQASAFCECDSDGLANVNILAVRDTLFDFREGKALGPVINATDDKHIIAGGGIDHNFVLDGKGFREVARLYSEKSGIEMICSTDQPGAQIYSGNFIAENIGKYGVKYRPHSAVCIETQGFPNSTSFAHFPSPILKKGDVYRHTTSYKLTVK